MDRFIKKSYHSSDYRLLIKIGLEAGSEDNVCMSQKDFKMLLDVYPYLWQFVSVKIYFLRFCIYIFILPAFIMIISDVSVELDLLFLSVVSVD